MTCYFSQFHGLAEQSSSVGLLWAHSCRVIWWWAGGCTQHGLLKQLGLVLLQENPAASWSCIRGSQEQGLSHKCFANFGMFTHVSLAKASPSLTAKLKFKKLRNSLCLLIRRTCVVNLIFFQPFTKYAQIWEERMGQWRRQLRRVGCELMFSTSWK
jgi:hypothetical protein